MSDLTKELQERIQVLKSRILDTQDALQQKAQSEQELASALTEIATILGIEGNNGQIHLSTIVDSVKELLVSKEFETEAE